VDALKWVGAASIASGAVLLAAPEAAGELYALPARRTLLRVLGARDVAIGLAMLAPQTARRACRWRALADGLDAVLIASERVRGERALAEVAPRLLGALALSALAARLSARVA
jgi:hypothetical protein